MARRRPDLALPGHSFVQGKTPRPTAGWADGVVDEDAFVFACDLFDAGFFFEAHEQWERPWLAARARGDDDDEALVHGLIKLAAAGVKLLAGEPKGVAAHVDGAAGHFARVVVWGRGFSRAVVDAAAAALVAGERPRLDEARP